MSNHQVFNKKEIKQQELKKKTNFNYIVVGGGLSGLSTVFWLKHCQPDSSILLVERKNLGAEASGKNAGFLTVGSAAFYRKIELEKGPQFALNLLQFCAENHRLLQEYIIDPLKLKSYRKQGSYSLYSDGAQADDAQNWWARSALAQQYFRLLSQQELQGLALQGFSKGFYYAEDASIDPLELVPSLFQRIEEIHAGGVELLLGASARRCWQTKEQAFVELESGTVVQCQKLIVCLNAFTKSLLPQLSDRVWPVRGQVLAMKPDRNRLALASTPFLCKAPAQSPPQRSPLDGSHQERSSHSVPLCLLGNIYSCSERVYLRQTLEGEIICGGLRLLDEAQEQTEVEALNPRIQEGLFEFLQKNLMKGDGNSWRIQRQWSGIMGFNARELPEVIPLGGPEGRVISLVGYSGHGMGMAFHCGKVLSEWLVQRGPLPPFLKGTAAEAAP